MRSGPNWGTRLRAALQTQVPPTQTRPPAGLGPLAAETSAHNRRWHKLILALMFVLAGAIRLYHLQAPGVLIDREYTSAILARDFYFELRPPPEAWRQEIAHVTRLNQPTLEPPLTEYLVSLLYWAAGSEQWWLARLLTSLFWLAGGLFMYLIARLVASAGGALIATAYYLLLPLSILLSRSFQPDALMMLLFLASIFCMLRLFEAPSNARLLLAGGVTGLALLYRPLVLFALLGASVALSIYHHGSLRRAVNRPLLALLTLSLLPGALYYGNGFFVTGDLLWKANTSFRPDLMLHRVYWQGWLELARSGVGETALLGALVGWPLLPRGAARALLVGLGLGYVIFGLVFTMHIHTHGYYQAQLIPIVALAFSPLVASGLPQPRQEWLKWHAGLPLIGALLLASLFSFMQVRRELAVDRRFEPEAVAHEIGDLVHHSRQVVFLSPYYGLPLEYHGALAGVYWPRRFSYYLYRRPSDHEQTIQERLDALPFLPEYFVVTDFREYAANHADLKAYLEAHCTLLAASSRYEIHHHCTP